MNKAIYTSIFPPSDILTPRFFGRGIRLLPALICCLILAAAQPAGVLAQRPGKAGIKIGTEKAGMHRLTKSDITEAGLEIDRFNADRLRLFRGDTEIAFSPISNDNLVFFAPGIDNAYTGNDVYWLYENSGGGVAMNAANRPPDSSLPTVGAFTDTLRIEENHELWTSTPGSPAADYWFWDKLTAPESGQYSFSVPSPAQNGAEATLKVTFQGRSLSDHRVTIGLNGNRLATAGWSGNTAHTATVSVPDGVLASGDNELTLSLAAGSGGDMDVIYFNHARLSYRRQLTAADNRLTFSVTRAAAAEISVTGFTKSDIDVYDVTDPASVRRIKGAEISSAGSGHRIAFAHNGGERTYCAVAAGAYHTPKTLRRRPAPDLKTGGGEYILITSDALMGATKKLRQLRKRQGLEVRKIDIEAVYDTFSGGRFAPQAIRDFLAYAGANWRPSPRFVLLVGDANLDYRDYFETGKKNVVPVHLSHTPELGLTPSDNRYACIRGDDRIPDLFLGRLPGNDADTVAGMVYKIVRYETAGAAPEQALFVADDDDSAFEALNTELAGYLPDTFDSHFVNSRDYSAIDDATSDIVSRVNAGTLLATYTGHGDVRRWGVEPEGGGDFLLAPSDLANLDNTGQPPFVLALNCLNGYFGQSHHYSLAEQWVMPARGGAIACFAPSGLSHQWGHAMLSRNLFAGLFRERETNLGALTTEAKTQTFYDTGSEKALISFNLIGDPATHLAVFEDGAPAVETHTVTAKSGSGGTIAPSGLVPVFAGEDETFAIRPASGYKIADVKVDGNSQGAVSEYRLSAVDADHTIRATFAKNGGGGGGGGCFIHAISESE